jgi:hypothetical protein
LGRAQSGVLRLNEAVITSYSNGAAVKPRVCNSISSLTTDIDLDAKWDAVEADAAVNRCVAAVTQSLKSPSPRFTDSERAHLLQLFPAMKHGHRAVRELLRHEGEQALSVNVMSLVRTQVETLYAMCLIIEQPSFLGDYLKDGWKKLFVRHLAMREECRTLPRVRDGLKKPEMWLEQMRIASGVTDAEKLTVETEELGTPLPPGMTPAKISDFPTPNRVIQKISDPSRKQMLMRLYLEYRFLCGFVHFSPASVILSSILDDRQPFRRMFTSGQIIEMYQKEIAGPAMWLDVLSIIQCCSEFVEIYPGDIELARCCVEAWRPLIENTFIGRIIWELRTKKLLGALG